MLKRRLSALACAICCTDFDSGAFAPMIGTCGHTVCAPCVEKISRRCPFCRTETFQKPAKNFTVLETLTEIEVPEKKEATERSDDDCVSCGEKVDEDEALICVTCLQTNGPMNVAEFLTETQKKRTCGACAKSGPLHGHHCQRKANVISTVCSKEIEILAKATLDDKLSKEFEPAHDAVRRSVEDFVELVKNMGKLDLPLKELQFARSQMSANCQAFVNDAKNVLADHWAAVAKIQQSIAAVKEFIRGSVDYAPEDKNVLNLVDFAKPTVTRCLTRPRNVRQASDFYYAENARRLNEKARIAVDARTSRELAEEEYKALDDHSKWEKLEDEDKIRFAKEMAYYFAQ